MSDEILKRLGPLAALAGTWEGDQGADVAPAADRGTANSKYRERITFVPFGPVDNHEQQLYGLRYTTVAHRIGADSAFHEETGYWLWDSKEKQILRSFMVPRGVTVLAGGTAEPGATTFKLAAEAGSDTYGICSNKFLDREFKTVRYELTVTVSDGGKKLAYDEDTQLKIRGQDKIFHHTDRNTLKRV